MEEEEKVDEKKVIGKWIITMLLAGVILILAVPLLLGAGYTYPAADDFILESGSITRINVLGPVRGPLSAAWSYFMDWQGAYTTNLLLFTVIPFTRFGLNGFRIVMVLLSLSFIGTLYFMVNAVINFSQISEPESDRHNKQNKKLFLYAVLLFTALGLPRTLIGKELFYWYTAALGYLVGICSMFISIGCFLSANCSERKKTYYICSILFAFIASGVSPQVASFVCSWLLLALLALILSIWPDRKQIRFWDVCPFLAAFCGALINVAAPGSWRRSSATMGDTYYGVADAIKDTFKCQKSVLGQIWHEPVFLALAVILFLVCICYEVRVTKTGAMTWIGVLLMFCSALVSNFLCIFPVMLGYHGGGLSNDRTQYVAEFEIRFSLLFAIIYIAQYISQILSEKKMRSRVFYLVSAICGVLVCTGGFLFLNHQPEGLFSGYSFELIRELSNGTVQEVFSLRKEVLDTLEAAEEGTDVYVAMPSMPFSRVTYSQGISTDPDYLVNQDVASLFHLNSVMVEYGAR